MENLTKCYCGHTTTCDCIPEQERSYSEEEVINLLYIRSMCQEHYESDAEVREWFNKFKKK